MLCKDKPQFDKLSDRAKLKEADALIEEAKLMSSKAFITCLIKKLEFEIAKLEHSAESLRTCTSDSTSSINLAIDICNKIASFEIQKSELESILPDSSAYITIHLDMAKDQMRKLLKRRTSVSSNIGLFVSIYCTKRDYLLDIDVPENHIDQLFFEMDKMKANLHAYSEIFEKDHPALCGKLSELLGGRLDIIEDPNDRSKLYFNQSDEHCCSIVVAYIDMVSRTLI